MLNVPNDSMIFLLPIMNHTVHFKFQLEIVILAPYPRLSLVEACAGMGTATYIMCRVCMAGVCLNCALCGDAMKFQ